MLLFIICFSWQSDWSDIWMSLLSSYPVPKDIFMSSYSAVEYDSLTLFPRFDELHPVI